MLDSNGLKTERNQSCPGAAAPACQESTQGREGLGLASLPAASRGAGSWLNSLLQELQLVDWELAVTEIWQQEPGLCGLLAWHTMGSSSAGSEGQQKKGSVPSLALQSPLPPL